MIWIRRFQSSRLDILVVPTLAWVGYIPGELDCLKFILKPIWSQKSAFYVLPMVFCPAADDTRNALNLISRNVYHLQI